MNERLFANETVETLITTHLEGFKVQVSRRERAIMETISLIGRGQSFEEASELFEGLTSLDPEVVQALLETCLSIKVKRVFLFLARQSGHAWFQKIDEFKIDLGKGNREVVKGGRLDSRYQITVPREGEKFR